MGLETNIPPQPRTATWQSTRKRCAAICAWLSASPNDGVLHFGFCWRQGCSEQGCCTCRCTQHRSCWLLRHCTVLQNQTQPHVSGMESSGPSSSQEQMDGESERGNFCLEIRAKQQLLVWEGSCSPMKTHGSGATDLQPKPHAAPARPTRDKVQTKIHTRCNQCSASRRS